MTNWVESREQALLALGLDEASADPQFDRIAAIASRMLEAPVTLISFVGDDRQVFKGACGLEGAAGASRQMPISHSSCQHVVSDERVLQVDDARIHPLVRQNPAVEELGVVGYLGVPVRRSDGRVLGAICAISPSARRWSATDMRDLELLAQFVEEEVNHRQVARRYRELYRQTPAMLHSIDSSGHLVNVNDYWLEKLGYSLTEVIGRRSTDFLTPESTQYALNEVLPAYMEAGFCRDVPYQFVRKDGSIMDVLLDATSETNDDGSFRRSVACLTDVTERVLAEGQLRQSEALLRKILDKICAFIAIMEPDGTVIESNLAPPLEDCEPGHGAKRRFWDYPLWIESGQARSQLRKAVRSAAGGQAVGHDLDVRADGGEFLTVALTIAPLFDDEGRITQLVASAIDISERKYLEQEILHQATHDPLTGLANRRQLMEQLARCHAEASRSGNSLGLFFLDLDHFKRINDSHGHAVGDAVLRLVAKRLEEAVSKDDLVARLGGDEFVILTRSVVSPNDSEHLASRLCRRVSRPAAVGDLVIGMSMSVGYTLFPQDPAEPESLLDHADAALYAAKKQGRGSYQAFQATGLPTEISRPNA
ncbi:MAG: diguanylate cyclase domain-containing protein [Geminicoccaceae bacterium]